VGHERKPVKRFLAKLAVYKRIFGSGESVESKTWLWSADHLAGGAGKKPPCGKAWGHVGTARPLRGQIGRAGRWGQIAAPDAIDLAAR
jgi:hypothetical protein